MVQYELERLKDIAEDKGIWAVRFLNEVEYWVPEALCELNERRLTNTQFEYASRMELLETQNSPQKAEEILWDEIKEKVKHDRRCLSDEDAFDIWHMRMDGAPIGEILQCVEEMRKTEAFEALIEDKLNYGRVLTEEEDAYIQELEYDHPLRKLQAEKKKEKLQDNEWPCTPMGLYEQMVSEANFSVEDCLHFIELKKKAVNRIIHSKKPEGVGSVIRYMDALKRYQNRVNAAQREYDFWKEVEALFDHYKSNLVE